MTISTSTQQNDLLIEVQISQRGNGHRVRTEALLNMLSTPKVRWEWVSDKADVILTDVGYQTYTWWEKLRRRGKPIIAIDDEGGPVYAHIIINGTPVRHHYPNAPYASYKMTGSQAALVRPEFAVRAWRPTGRAVILVGSGVRAERWAEDLAVRAKQAHADHATTGFTAEQLAAHFSSAWVITPRSGWAAERIAAALSTAPFALVTGGMAMYEAMATGCPTLVFPTEENHVEEVKALEKSGAVIDLGYESGGNAALTFAAVKNLMDTPGRQQALSAQARFTCDGLGLSRAAREVDRLLAQLRPRPAPRTEHDIIEFNSAEIIHD